MRIILTMAVSANGIIASKTDNEDFLLNTNWIQLVKIAKQIVCLCREGKPTKRYPNEVKK